MTRGMVVRPSKRATRRVSSPKGTRKTNLYRCFKCKLGCSFKSRIYRRTLNTKIPTYQPTRTEDSFSGSAILHEELHQQLSPHCLRQHLSGVVHQQAWWRKVSSSLCADEENLHLVPQQQCNTQSKAHTGFTQCYRGWPLQKRNQIQPTEWSLSIDFQENFQSMGESPGGPLHNQPEQNAPSLSLSNPRPSGLGSRCPQHPMGKLGMLFLPLLFCPRLYKNSSLKRAG